MAAAAVNGFVLVLSLLSVKPLVQSLIPATPSEDITNVKVLVGSTGQAAGSEPSIHLFDLNGTTVGLAKSGGDKIDLGIGHDMTVKHTGTGGGQAEYLSIVQGGSDALCFSAITVAIPNGPVYSFNGDIGFQCGAPWYFGNSTVSIDSDGAIYQPRCMWLGSGDGDNTNVNGYGIHLPSFIANQGRASEYAANNKAMCGAQPRFHAYDNLTQTSNIPYFKGQMFDLSTLVDFNVNNTLNPANWAIQSTEQTTHWWDSIFKREPDAETKAALLERSPVLPVSAPKRHQRRSAMYKRSPQMSGTLVVSPQPHHSATDLCGSDTSFGPDFISLDEGIYCDMDAKKTYPLCSSSIQNNCFDQTANTVRLDKRSVRRDSTGSILPPKTFHTVEQW